MAKRKQDKTHAPRIENRRARHDYEVLDTLECGVVLTGSEVKSVRHARVSLGEGYASVNPDTMELWLMNVDIALYPQAGPLQHAPKNARKLLAHKQQIKKLFGATTSEGRGSASLGCRRLRSAKRASTWTVLPRPMSSARQPPKPNFSRNRSQPRPSRW